MDPPPLNLEVLRLTPVTLVTGVGGVPLSSSASPAPVPTEAAPIPPLPASFTLSPTSNYPAPFGSLSLGENVGVHVRLTSADPGQEDVRGVKMMVEVQSPGGRYRLGEVIHGASGRAEGTEPAQAEDRGWEELPRLAHGQMIELDGKLDIKEMGAHVLICSVAWETTEGRRTFQRFLKFNVNTPLAIKTRIHTPSHPNSALSPSKRTDVYLEVLVQNISQAAMVFEHVGLEPIDGLVCRAIGAHDQVPDTLDRDDLHSTSALTGLPQPSLMPGDTSQHLFVLSPSQSRSPSDHETLDTNADVVADSERPIPTSSFPAVYAVGTVLPLGRLEVSWLSGPYRERGRLQTSTLNRRVLADQTAPPTRSPSAGPPTTPSRTTSAAPPSPAARGTPRPGPPASLVPPKADEPAWEFDLVVSDSPREVQVEHTYTLPLRVAVRSPPIPDDDEPAPQSPPQMYLGVQFLVPALLTPTTAAPSLALSPPSRPSSTLASPGPSRALTPASRPMTPISAQLRHAAVSSLSSTSTSSTPTLAATLHSIPPPPRADPPPPPPFPPSPVLDRAALPLKRAPLTSPAVAQIGRLAQIGTSLVVPPALTWHLVREQVGTTYPAEEVVGGAGVVGSGRKAARRWEAHIDVEARYFAMSEGLAELGGVRLLVLGDHTATAGSVGKEWDSLGDVWVSG